MLKILKRMYWDLKDPSLRFGYGWVFLRFFPGVAGTELRSNYVGRFLGKAGANIRVREGVRITGLKMLEIGDNSELGVDCYFQASGGLRIGKDVMTGPGVKIWTINHKYDNTEVNIRSQGWDCRAVDIGDGCWIGANAFIMPGTVLQQGCVVAACSNVGAKNYPAWSIIAGNPARVIGNRKS